MTTRPTLDTPIAPPEPVLALCAHLEEQGIPSFIHGDGLLEGLVPRLEGLVPREGEPREAGSRGTLSLLCEGGSAQVLRALPRAVVTGEGAKRVTQATTSGPVDLLFTDEARPEQALREFGLGPLGFAFRPADQSWCDPLAQRLAFQRGRLELMTQAPNPFEVAPRRYWIAARLMAEHGLEAAPEALAAARDVFPRIQARLPQATPARRELSRILSAPYPGLGLAFLRETGVSGLLVPGTQPENESWIRDLPELPALRWAAWLRGSATASALVRFRVPHLLARRIEKLQGSHPIDRSVEAGRDLGIRKLLQRHDDEEIDALLAWRRLELRSKGNQFEAGDGEERLRSIESRIDAFKAADRQAAKIQELALDGSAVMTLLNAGPGRHIGKALSHLARFAADRPEANERLALEAELRRWAAENTNLLD